jgi:bacillithiol system protein YtxJ
VTSNLIVLDSVEALERVILESEERLVLLFKHSVTCGTSAQAYDELVAHLNEGEHEAMFTIVTVQTHRDISDVVTRRLSVRHETPQALLIQDRCVVWEASHFRVTAQTIEEAIKRYTNGL